MPVATDGKVGPSTLESKRALLERLEMSERSLEVSPCPCSHCTALASLRSLALSAAALLKPNHGQNLWPYGSHHYCRHLLLCSMGRSGCGSGWQRMC